MDYDEKLIKALESKNKNKIERTFEKIYDNYSRLLFYISFKITNNEEESKDIVNDTFLKFFKNLNNIELKKVNIKYYLIQIAKNSSLDYLKKSKEENLDDELESKSNDYLKTELLIDLEKILTSEELDILIKYIVFDYRLVDLSKEYNMNINTISTLYRRMIIKIKDFYKGGE